MSTLHAYLQLFRCITHPIFSSFLSQHYSATMSDYGGTRRAPPDSRFSTMRTDATGDWQYFGPDQVPTQQRGMSIRRRGDEPLKSSHSDYYGPTSSSRLVEYM